MNIILGYNTLSERIYVERLKYKSRLKYVLNVSLCLNHNYYFLNNKL